MSRKSHSLFTKRNASSHLFKPLSINAVPSISHIRPPSIPLIPIPDTNRLQKQRSYTTLRKTNPYKDSKSYSPTAFTSLYSSRILLDKPNSPKTNVEDNTLEQSNYEYSELKENLRNKLQEVFKSYAEAFHVIAGDKKQTCNFFQMRSLLNELYLPSDEHTVKSLVKSISFTQSINFHQFKAFWLNKLNVCSIKECAAETEANQYLCEFHSRNIRRRGQNLIDEISQELDSRLYKKFHTALNFIQSKLGYGLVIDDIKRIMQDFVNIKKLSNIDLMSIVEHLRFFKKEEKRDELENELKVSRSSLNIGRRLKAFSSYR